MLFLLELLQTCKRSWVWAFQCKPGPGAQEAPGWGLPSSFNHSYVALLDVFPQAVWPHWGVLTVSVKARCSIEVVSEAFGIFPINFRTKCLLWHVHVHFDCAGSHKMLAPGIWVLHFPYKFPHKMPLLMSMCMSIVQARTKRWPREKRPAFSL